MENNAQLNNQDEDLQQQDQNQLEQNQDQQQLDDQQQMQDNDQLQEPMINDSQQVDQQDNQDQQQDDQTDNNTLDQQNRMQQQDPGFLTDEEIQNLKEIFDLFDKEKTGKIELKDLQAVMSTLQRDEGEVKQMIEQLQAEEGVDLSENAPITFDQFINMMQKIENQIVKSDPQNLKRQEFQRNSSQRGVINISADSKVLDFLRLLEEYRRKCEEEGNYAEARKSRAKFDELLKKETIRQKNNIKAAQEQELSNIEAAQKAQFLEFSQAWDNYMSDYEATAYLSLEKLKEKHMLEFQQFQEKIRKELHAKMKFSKDLLELRDKENKLVRMKRYEEAEKIKMKADLLEEFERNKLEAEMQAIIEKKEAKLRHSQQLALAALLKRIQRDRNEQLKHRQQDSQRLIQRNKNILNDLLNKQSQETKKTLEHLKQTLGMTKLDKLYENEVVSNNQKRSTNLPSSSYSKKRAR